MYRLLKRILVSATVCMLFLPLCVSASMAYNKTASTTSNDIVLDDLMVYTSTVGIVNPLDTTNVNMMPYVQGTWTKNTVTVNLGTNATGALFQDSLTKANGTLVHTWTNCNTSISYSSDTNIFVKYRTMSGTDSGSATNAYNIKIDRTAPIVTITPTSYTPISNRALDTMRVRVTFSDAVSGIDSVVWTLKTSAGSPISGRISPANNDTTFILFIPSDATYNTVDDTISVTAYDKAGNASNTSPLIVLIKKRPYNASELSYLQRFLRKPSAISNKLNIDQLWKTGTVDTSTWRTTDSMYWADNIEGLTWGVSGSERMLTKIEWTNQNLGDTLNLYSFSLLDTVRFDRNAIRSFLHTGTINIKQLWCNNNKLNQLDVDGLTMLKDLSCGGNALKFSTLPQGTYVSYIYYPQDTILLQNGIADTINLNTESNISGKITTYKWYEGGTEIPAANYRALGNGKFIFPDSYIGKTLIGNMQNSTFPDLTLVCRLNLSRSLDDIEVQKLKAFLLKPSAVSGTKNAEQVGLSADPDWDYASNLLASLSSITWNTDLPKRTKEINWGSKNLADSFDVSGFTQLSILELKTNKLTGLDVSGNTAITSLRCSNNLFRFSTLPKQQISGYVYNSQDEINETIAITDILDFSKEHTVTRIGGTPQTTTYEWRYNDKTVDDAASDLGGGKFRISDKYAGKTIICHLRNVAFPNLTLIANIQVNAVYDTAELAQLKTFLRLPSAEAGKTNIEQLGVQVDNWDYFSYLVPQVTSVVWDNIIPKKVTNINWSEKNLAGTLKLVNFASLLTLKCDGNTIDSLTVKNAPSLTTIECNNNKIYSIQISELSALNKLACGNNFLLFSTLPKESILDYTYSPQTETSRSIFVYEKLNLSAENTVERNATTYTTRYSIFDAATLMPIASNLYNVSADGYISFSSHLEDDTVICKLVNDGFSGLELSIRVELKKPHYNSNELNQLKTFLEKLSADEIKTNAEQLNIDLSLWDSPGKWPDSAGVRWTIDNDNSNANLLRLEWNKKYLAGNIDFSDCSKLNMLLCQENAITGINVANCPRLEEVDCFKNLITSFDIGGCPEVRYLTVSLNEIETLNLSSATKLIELYCHQNKLKQLNTSVCAELKTLACYNNNISNLDMSGTASLQKLYCQGNALKFSTLPEKEYATYAYFYQDSILFTNASTTTPINLSSEFNITRNGQSHNTVYTWYLKGSDTPITNGITANNGVFTFNSSFENQTVYGTMTNANFPGLSLNVQINFFVTGEREKPLINQAPIIQTVLYPNPASDVVNLKISGWSGKLNIEIVDNTGRVAKEQILQHIDENEGKQISVQNLSKGIYYVRLHSKEFTRTLKLIVQ